MNEPLIYTTKGNLLVSQLCYGTQWIDCDDYTKLIETYTLNGEVVKQSVHVMGKQKLDIGAVQQALN